MQRTNRLKPFLNGSEDLSFFDQTVLQPEREMGPHDRIDLKKPV
ncbi:MAG TPA: hypothetical protein PLS58_00085 [Bacteroidales bacterium]|nr:hypothetical protein [Bacteroidales bacterium]